MLPEFYSNFLLQVTTPPKYRSKKVLELSQEAARTQIVIFSTL